ncbi:MAG: sialate O-acetylesterase [Oscillospiraceae bacterium]|nr:sialate O-acetylesterase [Oscillospiraceae bacterium]
MPGLPFIAGNLVEQWRLLDEAHSAPVITATRAVCASIGKSAFVGIDGLKSNAQAPGGNKDDTIHFSREALYELGLRYFEAYLSVK